MLDIWGSLAHESIPGGQVLTPNLTNGRPSNNLQITQGAQCLHAYWYLSRIYTYNFQLHTYLWEVRRCIWTRPRSEALPALLHTETSGKPRVPYLTIKLRMLIFLSPHECTLVYINVSIHYTHYEFFFFYIQNEGKKARRISNIHPQMMLKNYTL